MADIKESTRKLLNKLSEGGIEVESSRKFANIKALDPLNIFVNRFDFNLEKNDNTIHMRIYYPDKESEKALGKGKKVVLFFHGGGWVTETVQNYDRVCARMAKFTDRIVVSVDYRLAPENQFPKGLEDCYEAAKYVYSDGFNLGITEDDIVIAGDSAGGNLAAAVVLMARDKGDFNPKKQILIYPVLNNDYSENSPYESVRTNGTDYFLTAQKMRDYVSLYIRDENDLLNPYFSPLQEKDLTNLPDTLVMTAELDPLRDEGEEYAGRLLEAGINVELYRIDGAFHGFFALGIMSLFVSECLTHIKEFLEA